VRREKRERERERKKEGCFCFYYNRVTCFPQKLLCSFFNTQPKTIFHYYREKEE
jgi:hypothetical protein